MNQSDIQPTPAAASKHASLRGPVLTLVSLLCALLIISFVEIPEKKVTLPHPTVAGVPEPAQDVPTQDKPKAEAEVQPEAVQTLSEVAPAPVPAPTIPAPVEREIDQQAIAQAQEALASATRDLERTEARARETASEFTAAQLALSQEMSAYRKFVKQFRDPSARIERAQTRLKQATAEIETLKTQLASLEKTPRPKGKPLLDKSPVARPAGSDEVHFEVHANRVSYLDIEGLMERLKVDARVQMRLMTSPRPISGTVGPVGAFSIRYQMVPSGMSLAESTGRGATLNASYGLSSWEIVPYQNLRGETYEQAVSPASDFAQATSRLDPQRDSITMWVYPDGFELYRVLRDQLHQRGFLISARPLPADMPIRGSPSGSISAAQ